MRRSVTALRHQFAQAGNGVFSDVLSAQEITDIVSTESGLNQDVMNYSGATNEINVLRQGFRNFSLGCVSPMSFAYRSAIGV